MKKILYFLLALLPLVGFTACDDNIAETDNDEFSHDWVNRNAKFFDERMADAKKAIADAQNTYGQDWENHCDWRIYRSFAKMPGGVTADSICVKITERGTGSGYPLYTDSVRVNYIGRLIPTENYPDGRVFDHSGLYEDKDYVFSPEFCSPTSLLVSSLIEGFTTALMEMRIGDRWRVYMPQELGYMSASAGLIPPYSALTFDIQLKGFYRKGESTTK